ncbi:Uncharacterized protein M6B38_242545 [Iris pallida]|uniref:Uncharacterized protein n=1 Tax=Iris pallida TaxID=29817 RepID=A0AAX6DJR5_IRIPA|nr:Uncharacterized protein M6B38_242545 [Iris pallida]
MDPVSVMISSSPSSEERFWSKLRDRVDTILEQRKPENPRCGGTGGVESSAGKRLRDEEEEDSLLLLRGFDSAASSLSQLTTTLNAAQQGLIDLVKPFSTQVQQREREEGSAEDDEDGHPHAKRHCGPDKLPIKDQGVSAEKNDAPVAAQEEAASGDGCEEAKPVPADIAKSGNLKKARALAISMASKATTLAKELKMIKTRLSFMQERCSLLEEENKRLRDGVEKGVRAEEDDLVRLQLEALLAEKSRLANENASLTRENQCLHQLVEYHQLATQDLSSPQYEQAIDGMRLDFSSPELEHEDDYAYDHSAHEENSQEE